MPETVAASSEVARFRRAVGRYATGIAVVTTAADGEDHAMTANSFTSVSLDPLMVLVCVERDSRFHEAVLASGNWAVSFLPAGGEATARWFAKRGRPLSGQFSGHVCERGGNGAMLLSHRLAALEVRTIEVVTAGDHDILIASVERIHDPVDDAGPTVFFASTYHELAPHAASAPGSDVA
jgi:flavin reductase